MRTKVDVVLFDENVVVLGINSNINSALLRNVNLASRLRSIFRVPCAVINNICDISD